MIMDCTFLFLFVYLFFCFPLPYWTVSSLRACPIVFSKFDTYMSWMVGCVLIPTTENSVFWQRKGWLQEGEVEQGFAKETAFELCSVKMGRVLPTEEGGRSTPDKGNNMKELLGNSGDWGTGE